MLLHHKQNTFRTGQPPSPLQSSHVHTALPRRHSLTAKTKVRAVPQSPNKTITIKPDIDFNTPLEMINSNQLLPHSNQLVPRSGYSFSNNQMNSFDDLRLEDFLKFAIVGENKVTGDKSEEIIKSLNGTWFKSTQSNELASSYKLYNNLGIRKTQTRGRNSQEGHSFGDKDPSNAHFIKEYTPPNVFPGRKIGTTRQYPSRSYLCDSKAELRLGQDSPLKVNIMRKWPSLSAHTSSFKRSATHFQKKRSQFFSTRSRDPQLAEGLIAGTKMVLHRD